MSPIFDVNLPKSQEPEFPPRCIACEKAPDTTYRIRTHAIGWWTYVLWIFGPRFCVDVPVCGDCRGRFIRHYWFRQLLTVLAIVLGLAVAVYLVGAYRGPFKKPLILGVTVLCVIPYFVWQFFFPPLIDIYAYTETVDYQFRDEDYADEFAALNVESNYSIDQDEEQDN